LITPTNNRPTPGVSNQKLRETSGTSSAVVTTCATI